MKSTIFNSRAKRGREAKPVNKHNFKRLLHAEPPAQEKDCAGVNLCAACQRRPACQALYSQDRDRRLPDKAYGSKRLFSLTSMGILYFVVVALSGFFAIAQVNLINKAGQEIIRSLRSRVLKHSAAAALVSG